MRGLLIHQIFHSGAEAGSTRHYELVRHLIKQGHEITVVTSNVHYLSNQHIGTAQNRWVSDEVVDGIPIRRTWTRAGMHGGFWGRIISFLSFTFSSFWGSLSLPKVEVVWGTTPPIFQAITAYLIARVKGAVFVLEVRDLWPDFAIGMGALRNPILITASRWLERFLYRHADQLIINSPGFLSHLRRFGVSEEKIALIQNGVEVDSFDPNGDGKEVRKEFQLNDKFIALYAGAHGLANDLMTVIHAAKKLEQYKDVVFVLVGDGKEKANLMERAKELNLSNVIFLPPQPKNRMPDILAASDVGIAILKDIPMFKTTYPNKVFDYMAAGRATVLAIDGVIRDVIESCSGGTFVTPGNADELAAAVLRYYQMPELKREHGKQARYEVEANFDRQSQAVKLESLLEELTTRKKGGKLAYRLSKSSLDI